MPQMDPDQTVHRRIYMRPDVFKWVENRPSDDKGRKYFVTVREFLKGFVIGDHFDNPNKLKNLDVDDLKLPDQGFYAFRLQRADPKARIFGSFAAENIFVCTHHKGRAGIKWAEEKARIQSIWTSQFRPRISTASGHKVMPLPRINDKTRTELTSNNRVP